MTLRFLAEAVREAQAAARWYERREVGLGQTFNERLVERARQAEALPGGGRLERSAPPEHDLRWFDLKQFPYALLIGKTADGARLVLAVAHHKRRPGYWSARLSEL